MTWVIKLGGALLQEERLSAVAEIVAGCGTSEPTVVVHGGGRSVSDISRRLGLTPRFEEGLRVTDAETLEVVLMVLAGLVNRSLVAALTRAGARAAGVCGGNEVLAEAAPLRPRLGSVGAITSVNPRLLKVLLAEGCLPVVASLALSAEGSWLNVNADQMAAAVASTLGASRLVFLTDVPGVLSGDGSVLPRLDLFEARRMIAAGAVRGGMRPKLQACGDALAAGVPEVLILSGAEAGDLGFGRIPSTGTRVTL